MVNISFWGFHSLVEMCACICVQMRWVLRGKRRERSTHQKESTGKSGIQYHVFFLRITGLIVLVCYSMLIGLIFNLWNVCVSSESFIHKPHSLSHSCVSTSEVTTHTKHFWYVKMLKIWKIKIHLNAKQNKQDKTGYSNLNHVVYHYYKCQDYWF